MKLPAAILTELDTAVYHTKGDANPIWLLAAAKMLENIAEEIRAEVKKNTGQVPGLDLR